MHFINNYYALIVTSNTFALQTPQRSTPVTMNCLSCALKCFEKNMACHLAPKHSLNPLEYECLRKLTWHDAHKKEGKKGGKGGGAQRRDLEMIQTRKKGKDVFTI